MKKVVISKKIGLGIVILSLTMSMAGCFEKNDSTATGKTEINVTQVKTGGKVTMKQRSPEIEQTLKSVTGTISSTVATESGINIPPVEVEMTINSNGNITNVNMSTKFDMSTFGSINISSTQNMAYKNGNPDSINSSFSSNINYKSTMIVPVNTPQFNIDLPLESSSSIITTTSSVKTFVANSSGKIVSANITETDVSKGTIRMSASIPSNIDTTTAAIVSAMIPMMTTTTAIDTSTIKTYLYAYEYTGDKITKITKSSTSNGAIVKTESTQVITYNNSGKINTATVTTAGYEGFSNSSTTTADTYGYDSNGRLKTITTISTFGNTSTTRVTTFDYGATKITIRADGVLSAEYDINLGLDPYEMSYYMGLFGN